MAQTDIRFLQAPRRCPWKDWQEWALLHSTVTARQVVSSDDFQRLRQVGGVPTALSASQQLLECSAARDDEITRLAIALVLVRAINMLADSLQQGQFASSIAELAGRLGVPRWLVDVRHDATHGQLPSTRTLAVGAKTLLDFLLVRYWSQQHQRLVEAGAVRASLPALPRSVQGLDHTPRAVMKRAKRVAAGTSSSGGKRARPFDPHSLHGFLSPLVQDCYSCCGASDAAFTAWTHARCAEWTAVFAEGARGIRAALAETARQASEPALSASHAHALRRLTCWLSSSAVWRGEGHAAAAGPARARMRAVAAWTDRRLAPVVPAATLLGLHEVQHHRRKSSRAPPSVHAAVDVHGACMEHVAYALAACSHGEGEGRDKIEGAAGKPTAAEQLLMQTLAFGAVPHLPRPRAQAAGPDGRHGEARGTARAAGTSERPKAAAGAGARGAAVGLDLEQLEAMLSGFDGGPVQPSPPPCSTHGPPPVSHAQTPARPGHARRPKLAWSI